MDELRGIHVAFVVANEGVERVELTQPWDTVAQAGGDPKLIAPVLVPVQTMDHLDNSDSFPVDLATMDARVDDFGAVVLPGGVANADRLRMDSGAIGFLQAMFRAGRPAAVIGHGAWTLVEAGLVRGRRLTSWPSIKTDIRNAGGIWTEAATITCERGPNSLLSGRSRDDLSAFCVALIELLQRGPASGRSGDTPSPEWTRLDEKVDEAGRESFPASDPPAY